MIAKDIRYLSAEEEEISTLLTEIGIKRNVAKALVFLSQVEEATSREIERGTDLRQPEVSIAMRALKDREWIEDMENKAESKGRPVKIYQLSRPIGEIVDTIEEEKRKEIEYQIAIIKRIREFLSN